MREPQSRLKRAAGPVVVPAILFALLIGFVVWFRLTNAWPVPSDVRLEWMRGLLAIIVMLASVYTMLQALRTASDRARGARWLGWTFGLGILFIALLLNEVRTRFRDGLVPGFASGVHNRADLYYLSAVHQRMHNLVTELNTASIRLAANEAAAKATAEAAADTDASQSATREQRLALVNQLLTAELQWTETRVASTADFEDQRAAMSALAYDIFPTKAFAEAHHQFRERVRLEEAERATVADAELQQAAAQIEKHNPQLRTQLEIVSELNSRLRAAREARRKLPPELDLEESDEAYARAAELDRQLAALQSELASANENLSITATAVTAAEDTTMQLKNESADLKTRREIRQSIESGDLSGGLNRSQPWLRLPVALPGGCNWAIAYFGLTTLQMTLAIAGLLSIFPRLANCDQLLALGGLARYWFMQAAFACVWFVLFYIV